MVSPAILLLIVFFFVPVLLCFALAFTNARLISPEPTTIIGFENFTRLFGDPVFWKSLRNTFYFAVVVVPLQSGFALLLALLISAKVRGVYLQRGAGHRLAQQPNGGNAGHHVHVDLAGGRLPHGDLAVGPADHPR